MHILKKKKKKFMKRILKIDKERQMTSLIKMNLRIYKRINKILMIKQNKKYYNYLKFLKNF